MASAILCFAVQRAFRQHTRPAGLCKESGIGFKRKTYLKPLSNASSADLAVKRLISATRYGSNTYEFHLHICDQSQQSLPFDMVPR
eukprot:s1332_g7.t1